MSKSPLASSIATPWIGVALLDWQSPDLAGFYPDDVPEEWQLTWYANIAMAVVLPEARWLSALTDGVLSDWANETQNNFWFYLVCDSDVAVSKLSGAIEMLNGKCGGVILSPSCALDMNVSVDLLYWNNEVLLVAAESLREVKQEIDQWLACFQGMHGLVVLTGAMSSQIREVQTLLTLMGKVA